MATIFSVNNRNDIFARAGRIARETGLEAALQHSAHVIRVRRGEMIYAADRGIEYLDNVFTGAVNLLQFESEARAAILRVPDVTAVTSFEANIVDNALVYEIGLETIFGRGVINGNI